MDNVQQVHPSCAKAHNCLGLTLREVMKHWIVFYIFGLPNIVIYVAKLYSLKDSIDLKLKVTQNIFFSLLTCIKQLLLLTFCDSTAEIGVSFWTDGKG